MPMFRKVSKIGPSTLMVSLPSKWCKNFDVKQGDELFVSSEDRKLIFSKEKMNIDYGTYEVTINTDKPEVTKIVSLASLLLAPYLKGYSKIIINFDDDSFLPVIRTAVSDLLLGFEIIEQTKKSCVIKNIAVGIEEDFSVIFYRILMQTIQMSKMLEEAIEKKDFSLLERIPNEERFVDKLNYFCRRMLHVQRPAPEKNISHIYRIICLYEELVDAIKYFSQLILKNQKWPSKKLVSHLKQVTSFIELSSNFVRKLDEKKYWSERVKYNIYHSPDIYSKVPSEEAPLMSYLVMIVLRLIHVTDEELMKEPLF